MKNGKNHFGLKIGQFISTLRTTLSQGEIFASSIIIAYYILFSIFPIIIIIGNVLPLFHIDTAPIAEYLNLVFPDQVSKFIIENYINRLYFFWYCVCSLVIIKYG